VVYQKNNLGQTGREPLTFRLPTGSCATTSFLIFLLLVLLLLASMLLLLFMLLLAPCFCRCFLFVVTVTGVHNLALFHDVACIHAVAGVSSVTGVHAFVFSHALAGTHALAPMLLPVFLLLLALLILALLHYECCSMMSLLLLFFPRPCRKILPDSSGPWKGFFCIPKCRKSLPVSGMRPFSFYIPPCLKILVPRARPSLPPEASLLWQGGM
jgi:hypothetical protein